MPFPHGPSLRVLSTRLHPIPPTPVCPVTASVPPNRVGRAHHLVATHACASALVARRLKIRWFEPLRHRSRACLFHSALVLPNTTAWKTWKRPCLLCSALHFFLFLFIHPHTPWCPGLPMPLALGRLVSGLVVVPRVKGGGTEGHLLLICFFVCSPRAREGCV